MHDKGGVVDDTIVVRIGEESFVAFWNAPTGRRTTHGHPKDGRL